MRERLILLAAGSVAFGASLGSGFHFDDYAIFSDPALQSARGWLEVWAPLQTRPLTYFTFWLNRQLGAGDPLGYHLFNLLFHLAAVLLAWECLRRLLPERPALIAGVLFALHPMQSEAVNYVWARGIVLAGIFCFGALWQWLEGRPWSAVAWFALALLAKDVEANRKFAQELLGFQLPERALAEVLEDRGHARTCARLDSFVEIDDGAAQQFTDATCDRRLPSAHEADEKDVAHRLIRAR